MGRPHGARRGGGGGGGGGEGRGRGGGGGGGGGWERGGGEGGGRGVGGGRGRTWPMPRSRPDGADRDRRATSRGGGSGKGESANVCGCCAASADRARTGADGGQRCDERGRVPRKTGEWARPRCRRVAPSCSAPYAGWWGPRSRALFRRTDHHDHLAAFHLGHVLDLADFLRHRRPHAPAGCGPRFWCAISRPRNRSVTFTLSPFSRNRITLRILTS